MDLTQKEKVLIIVEAFGPIRTEQVKIKAMYQGVSCADRFLRWLSEEVTLIIPPHGAPVRRVGEGENIMNLMLLLFMLKNLIIEVNPLPSIILLGRIQGDSYGIISEQLYADIQEKTYHSDVLTQKTIEVCKYRISICCENYEEKADTVILQFNEFCLKQAISAYDSLWSVKILERIQK